MTFAQFKTMVAAFMQRDASTFVYGSFDWLTYAINMARKASERKRDFELCRTQAQVTVNLTTGVALSTAVLCSDGTTAVSIKSIRKAFTPDHNSLLYYPIRVTSREKYTNMLDRVYQNHDFDRAASQDLYYEPGVTSPYLVREADQVYLCPASTTMYGSTTNVLVKMDVIKWLADYSADGDTDFFLTHCVEYMLFKTVSLLQPFLKEDVRAPLALSQLKEAWLSVVAWDGQLVSAASSDDTNLD